MIEPQRIREILLGKGPTPVNRLFRRLLRGVSLVYSAGVRLRNLAYDVGVFRVERLPIPVISVGNLTVGGTGKTPTVELIARKIRQRDRRVTILSRGFGATDGPNDEALLLEENLPDVPHLQGPDRVSLARAAVEELDAEVILLDDGMQHRRLARSLEIVLIDATEPFGGGWLLPGGLLREPISSLKRADVVILSRVDMVSDEAVIGIEKQIRDLAPEVPIVPMRSIPVSLLRQDHPIASPEDLAGKRILAFAGIGNPDPFYRTLDLLGATVLDRIDFSDHHPYDLDDVGRLERWADKHAPDAVLTTQKDLVKLRLASLGVAPLWGLRIGAVLPVDDPRLDHLLDRILAASTRFEG